MADPSRDEIERLEAEYRSNPEGRLFVHLAEAYRRAGELERARILLREGLEKHPDYLSARIVLAQVEEALGRSREALRIWQEVVELDPENELALWALAELEREAGNIAEALRYCRRIEELGVEDEELQEMILLLESTLGESEREAEATEDADDSPAEPTEEHAAATPTIPGEGRASAAGRTAPLQGETPGGPREERDASDAPAPSAGPPKVAPPAPTSTRRPGRRETFSAGVVRQRERAAGSTSVIPSGPLSTTDLLARLLDYSKGSFGAETSLARLLAEGLARELGIAEPDVEGIGQAALLGSMGAKIARDQPLEADLQEVPVARELLLNVPLPRAVAEAILHRQERWDGRGSPDGLSGEGIPKTSRILAVAHAAASLLAQQGGPIGATEAILDQLRSETGSRFDPAVVMALERVLRNGATHGIGVRPGSRIAVAHTDAVRAIGLAAQFQGRGYRADLVPAAEALRMGHEALPDALVLGGYLDTTRLARHLRDARASRSATTTPLLIIDADDPELRIALLQAGADACLASDVDFRELAATLDALLRRVEEARSTE